MGIENFTPEIWSAAIQVPLRKDLVYGALTNRQYEGEIRNGGDKVKINEIGPITVNSYTRRGALTWQNPDSADKWLLVDQEKYFAVSIDDVDDMQANVSTMAAFGQQASYEVADDMDQFIAGKYTEAGLTQTAVTITAANILTNLTNIDYQMNNGKVPKSQPRYMPIHPRYHRLLLQATTGIIGHTGVPKLMNDGIIVSGYVGTLFGINLLVSNNVVESSSTKFEHMCFTSDAIAFVQQLTKLEAVRRESYFDMGIKGLFVYGAKVVRPDKVCKCQTTLAAV